MTFYTIKAFWVFVQIKVIYFSKKLIFLESKHASGFSRSTWFIFNIFGSIFIKMHEKLFIQYSRVVFLFFQCIFADSFYFKLNGLGSTVRTNISQALGPGSNPSHRFLWIQKIMILPPSSSRLPPLLSTIFFDTRNFVKHRRVPLQIFWYSETKIFDGKSWYPLLIYKFFRYDVN